VTKRSTGDECLHGRQCAGRGRDLRHDGLEAVGHVERREYGVDWMFKNGTGGTRDAEQKTWNAELLGALTKLWGSRGDDEPRLSDVQTFRSRVGRWPYTVRRPTRPFIAPSRITSRTSSGRMSSSATGGGPDCNV
jgi:hypothetical protein